MPWGYKIDSDQNLIEVQYTGKVTAQDLQESTSKVIALEKATGIHSILSDTTKANLVATLPDLYDIPIKQYVEEAADRLGRLAIILSTSTKEKQAAEFFEIVCQSAGWQVQTFSDRQLALDWLRSSG